MTSVAKSIQDILIFYDFPHNNQTSAENNSKKIFKQNEVKE